MNLGVFSVTSKGGQEKKGGGESYQKSSWTIWAPSQGRVKKKTGGCESKMGGSHSSKQKDSLTKKRTNHNWKGVGREEK